MATSAYQIERASDEDGKGESIWDRFVHPPGKAKNGDTRDVVNDDYDRHRKGVTLLASFATTAYRFPISWPRAFPERD